MTSAKWRGSSSLYEIQKCDALFGAVYSHVADQLALPLDATPPGSYRQRGASSLQRLFRAHFTELVTRYEYEFAKRLGKFRLERITKAVGRYLDCGDHRRGVARIQRTNPLGGSRACAA